MWYVLSLSEIPRAYVRACVHADLAANAPVSASMQAWHNAKTDKEREGVMAFFASPSVVLYKGTGHYIQLSQFS